MEKEEKEENNEIKTTHNKLQRIISKTTKCLQNFDSQSNSAKTVSSIHSTGSADRIIFDCTHFVNIVSYGGILHWWRLVLIHKKNPKTTKIKVRFNISTVANTKEVNDHKIQRETQPWRHITLEEQDARVSANFTQKRQEKKCSYLQAKKKKKNPSFQLNCKYSRLSKITIIKTKFYSTRFTTGGVEGKHRASLKCQLLAV